MSEDNAPGGNRDAGSRRPLYYGWTILGVAVLAVFVSSPGQTYVVSVFVDPIQRDTGWSRTLISGLYTVASLTAATGMIAVGRLMDRFGARATLTGVALAFGLAAVWMSRVAHPLELYIGFVLLRFLGQGALTVIPTAMVALWFIRLRGRALSLVSLGAVAGQGLFPPIVHLLIAQTDWRTAWLLLAAVIWGLLLLPALVLVRPTPESMGLRPDGDAPRHRSSLGEQAGAPRSESAWTLAEAVRTRTFWLLAFATSAQSLISTALTFHQMSFMVSLGLEPATASTVFTVIAAASLAGTLLVGVLSDRFAGRHLLAASQVLLASAMVWSFAIAAPWHAFVYGSLLGLAGGFNFTLQSVMWPNYFGRRNLGSIRSAAASATIAAAAIGPLPFGWMFDLTSSYRVPILVFLTLPVAATVAALLAAPPRR